MIELSESTTDSIELILTAPTKAVFFYQVEMRSCCTDEWTALPVRLRANGEEPVKVWVDRLDHGHSYTFRAIANYEDSTVAVGPSIPFRTTPAATAVATRITCTAAFTLAWGVLGVAAARIATTCSTIQAGGVAPEMTDQHDIEDIAVHVDHIKKARRIRHHQQRARSKTLRQAPGDVTTGISQRSCKHRKAIKGTRHQRTALTAGLPGVDRLIATKTDTKAIRTCTTPSERSDLIRATTDTPRPSVTVNVAGPTAKHNVAPGVKLNESTVLDATGPITPCASGPVQDVLPVPQLSTQAAAIKAAIESGVGVKCCAVQLPERTSPPVSPVRMEQQAKLKQKGAAAAASTLQPVMLPGEQQTSCGSGTVDTILDRAERCWMSGHLQDSLQHYDDALKLAREAGDGMIEGMVLAGKGCALASSKDRTLLLDALDCYKRSKQLAEAGGMTNQVKFMESLINGVAESLGIHQEMLERQSAHKLDCSTNTGTDTECTAGSSSSTNNGSDESSPSQEQQPWQLDLLYNSRVMDDNVTQVVMWQISAQNVMRMILGCAASPPIDENITAISFTREQALQLTRNVANVLSLAPADVSTRIVKTPKSANEIAAFVYVRTESFVSKIHAAFDLDKSGCLSFVETKKFLSTIRCLDPADYVAFCNSVRAEPSDGISKETLLKFYLTCEPGSLVEEFQLLIASFATPPSALANSNSQDDQSDASKLSLLDMVHLIYENFDADGDGMLKFDEFSCVLSSMLALTEKQFEEICEALGVDPSLGLTASALMKWYKNEANMDQLYLDYSNTVLGRMPSVADTTQARQARLQVQLDNDHQEDNAAPRRAAVNSASTCDNVQRAQALLQDGKYADCVRLLSEMIHSVAESKQNRAPTDECTDIDSENALEPRQQRHRTRWKEEEAACRQAFLYAMRGNARFKLCEYSHALSDYKNALITSGMKWEELCDEQKRRIRICKLKLRKGSGENDGCTQTTLEEQMAASSTEMDESERDPLRPCAVGSFEALVAEFKSEGGLDPRRNGTTHVVGGSSGPSTTGRDVSKKAVKKKLHNGCRR
eukprot:COSAG02_NODE_681_length_18539_cov_44.668925_10_plen_1058_part_00